MIKKILVFIILISNFLILDAQTSEIDSLKIVVQNLTKKDSVFINNLIKIGKKYEYTTPDTALFYFEKALKVSTEIKDKSHKAECLNYIGIVYNAKSNYQKSIECFQEALGINKEIDDKKAQANNITNIGGAYSKKGDYSKALEYYQKALKINEEIDSKKGVAILLVNIGLVYKNRGENLKALEYYERAVKMEAISSNKRYAAIVNLNIGTIYFSQNDFTKALEYFNQSLKAFRELNFKNAIAVNLINIGQIYTNKKDFSEALKYYNEALIISKEINNKDNYAETLVSIASLYIDKKEYKKAIIYAKKALKLAKEIETLNLEKKSYFYLYDAYKGLKDYKKALIYNELAIELKDSIFNTEKAKIIEEMQAKYESEKKEKQIIKQQAELKTNKLEIDKEKTENQKRKLQRNMFIIAFGLMLVVTIIILRLFKQKKKDNILLKNQKLEIEEKNKEVTVINNDLLLQKAFVEEQSVKLQAANEETQAINEELRQQQEEMYAINNSLQDKQVIIEKQNSELSQTLEIVTVQQEKLQEINKNISDSINYAKTIQQALLTREEMFKLLFSDYFIFFKPKETVSGDFYYANKVDKNIIFAVADCTGHGVPGGFLTMLAVTYLHDAVRRQEADSIGEVLDVLRKRIKDVFVQFGTRNQNGLDIALCSIDIETNILQYAGAYNPLIIIRDEKIIEYKATRNPIGWYPKEKPFATSEIQLQDNDIIYLYSDGFHDQLGGTKYKKFSSRRFKELLLQIHTLPMEQQQNMLDNILQNWKGQNEQTDDIAIMGIKYQPKKG